MQYQKKIKRIGLRGSSSWLDSCWSNSAAWKTVYGFNDSMVRGAGAKAQLHVLRVSTLLSIKTGACLKIVNYCPQITHYRTDVDKKEEQLNGSRACFGCGAKSQERGFDSFLYGRGMEKPERTRYTSLQHDPEKGVKGMGLETCMTLRYAGIADQAGELADAGLDYYNHNLDAHLRSSTAASLLLVLARIRWYSISRTWCRNEDLLGRYYWYGWKH